MRRIGALAAVWLLVVAAGADARPRVHDTAVAGSHVARIDVDRGLATVRTVDRSTGRRRAYPAGLWVDGPDRSLRLRVAVTARGDLAYTRYRARHDRDVIARWGGGRVRKLGHGSVFFVGFEDGVTVRWRYANSPIPRFFDVRPPPVRDGCPARARFGAVATYGDVRVTRARFYDRLGSAELLRACRVGSGRDTLVAQGSDERNGGVDVRAAGAQNGFVAIVKTFSDARSPCVAHGVETIGVATGAQRTGSFGDRCGEHGAPPPGAPTVITTSGAPAWVADGVLYALTHPTVVVELDRGAIADLRADGELVRWTDGGEPREARP